MLSSARAHSSHGGCAQVPLRAYSAVGILAYLQQRVAARGLTCARISSFDRDIAATDAVRVAASEPYLSHLAPIAAVREYSEYQIPKVPARHCAPICPVPAAAVCARPTQCRFGCHSRVQRTAVPFAPPEQRRAAELIRYKRRQAVALCASPFVTEASSAIGFARIRSECGCAPAAAIGGQRSAAQCRVLGVLGPRGQLGRACGGVQL